MSIFKSRACLPVTTLNIPMPLPYKTCATCGRSVKLIKEKIYQVNKDGVDCFGKTLVPSYLTYDAIDCETCGCQMVLGRRSARIKSVIIDK